MASFLPDTDCIVATLSSKHVHHVRARAALETRLNRGDTMVIAAPTLAETYSVLTRSPPPMRTRPDDAVSMIEENFAAQGTVVALDSAAYLSVIRRAPSNGVFGGRVYDAVIAACARAAAVDTILTFNERHFRQFAGDGLSITVP